MLRKLNLLPLVLLLGITGCDAAPATGQAYALVVGINQYGQGDSLKGAVNDADDIYGSLRETGIPATNITKLLDGEATRQHIIDAWGEMVEGSAAGDTLIFTFAGHGTLEDDTNGDEATRDPSDKWDEALVLGGDDGLLDDELDVMFRKAKGRTVIYVADACHSGGSSRSIDPRAQAFASRFRPPRPDEPLKSGPQMALPASGQEMELDNFYSLAGSKSADTVQEVSINGIPRGALSWAFARAFREANQDGDNTLSAGELFAYIQQAVADQSEKRQFAVLEPRSRDADATLLPAIPGKVVATLPTMVGNTPVRVVVRGAVPKGTGELAGITLVDSNPDVTWDIASGDVLNKTGDLAAVNVRNPEGMASVIARHHLLAAIQRLAMGHSVDSQFGNTERETHAIGDEIAFSIDGMKHNTLLQFNLAGNGNVQCFSPAKVDANNSKQYGFEAIEPVGNDTLVTLVTDNPSDALINLLDEKGCPDTDALASELPGLLQGKDYQLSYVDTFVGKGK